LKYRPEIDGLRAIAVLPVILFHAGAEQFSGGYVGVDVFFVISGYLITTIIIGELEQGSFRLVNFYERRARRILPALSLVLLVCIPFAWILLLPWDMKDFSQSLVSVALFSSNIFFYLKSGYFELESELKPLLHTWSLAVEEQFYILFPLLLMACWKFGLRVVLPILATLFLVSLALAQWGSQHSPSAAFYLLPTRAWELLLGSFCAFYLWRAKTHPDMAAQVFSALGFALILAAVFWFDQSTPTPSVYTLIPTVGTALIILFAGPGTFIKSLLGTRALVGLGLISYSAYLWHQPIIAFYRHADPARVLDVSFILQVMALTLILSVLSWRFVEKPCRDKNVVGRTTVFLASAGMAAIIIVVGQAGHLTKGHEGRFARADVIGEPSIEAFLDYMKAMSVDCSAERVAAAALVERGFRRCKQTRPGSADVVLLGDSHAEHLFPGVAAALPDQTIAYYIKNSIPYMDAPEFKYIFEELQQNGLQQTVLLTFHYSRRLRTSEMKAEFRTRLEGTVAWLQARNKKVVLIGDVPRFEFSAEACVYVRKFNVLGPKLTCAMDATEAKHQLETYWQVLEEIAQHLETKLIRLDDMTCDELNCWMTLDKQLIYRDSNHLTVQGSKVAGRRIADALGVGQ
jgi:peptidoglycan/LPS O-acetylase OafA/YrhL